MRPLSEKSPTEKQLAERNNILTINLEDYYQVGAFQQFIEPNQWERFDTRIKRNTHSFLALLNQTASQATFYVNAWIAENQPEILRIITTQGHEIACLGNYREGIANIRPNVFREDVRRSKQTIENITGVAVNGFRVGPGWVGPDDLWVLEILQEEGYKHDSSLCAIGRQFFDTNQKRFLHEHRTVNGSIWEVPISTALLYRWSLPFAGGNYVRQLPNWPIRALASRWVDRHEAPLVMYFHLWELDVEQPTINAASWWQRMRHYRNLNRMPERMGYFLSQYPFTSVDKYLDIAPELPSPTTMRWGSNEASLDDEESNAQLKHWDITIVIPCYNEEDSLPYLKNTLDKLASESQSVFQLNFVFVNDGSTDDTLGKLRSLFGTQKNCKIVEHEENYGIGRAVMTGFEQATTNFVAVIDADCTFDPLQLISMMDLMEPDVACIAASPFHSRGLTGNAPAWRLLLSKCAASLYRTVLNHQFSSYTSCFRVYRRSSVENMSIYNDGFCGITEIIARLDLAGDKLVECPTELRTRLLGESKINLINTTFDHIKLLVRLALCRCLNVPLPGGKLRPLK